MNVIELLRQLALLWAIILVCISPLAAAVADDSVAECEPCIPGCLCTAISSGCELKCVNQPLESLPEITALPDVNILTSL